MPNKVLDKTFVLAIICSLLIAFRKCEDAVVTHEAALDMAIGNRPIGRIMIGLFGQIVPKTVTNFVALANHEVTFQNKLHLFLFSNFFFNGKYKIFYVCNSNATGIIEMQKLGSFDIENRGCHWKCYWQTQPWNKTRICRCKLGWKDSRKIHTSGGGGVSILYKKPWQTG